MRVAVVAALVAAAAAATGGAVGAAARAAGGESEAYPQVVAGPDAGPGHGNPFPGFVPLAMVPAGGLPYDPATFRPVPPQSEPGSVAAAEEVATTVAALLQTGSRVSASAADPGSLSPAGSDDGAGGDFPPSATEMLELDATPMMALLEDDAEALVELDATPMVPMVRGGLPGAPPAPGDELREAAELLEVDAASLLRLPGDRAAVGEAPLGLAPSRTTDFQMATPPHPRVHHPGSAAPDDEHCEIVWADDATADEESGSAESSRHCRSQKTLPPEHHKKLKRHVEPDPDVVVPRGMEKTTSVKIVIHPNGLANMAGEGSAAAGAGGESSDKNIAAAVQTIKRMVDQAVAARLEHSSEASESSKKSEESSESSKKSEESSESSKKSEESSESSGVKGVKGVKGPAESSESSASSEAVKKAVAAALKAKADEAAKKSAASAAAAAAAAAAAKGTNSTKGTNRVLGTSVTDAGDGVKVVTVTGTEATTTQITHSDPAKPKKSSAEEEAERAAEAKLVADAIKESEGAEKLANAASAAALAQHHAVASNSAPGTTDVTTTTVHAQLK